MKDSLILLVLCILLFGCKKEGPPECPDCQNNGVCNMGVCDCNGLWTGEDCSEQIDPLVLTIDKIRFDKFPLSDNGANWDFGSGPDLYIKVIQNGNVIYTSTYSQNGTIGTVLPVVLDIPNPANWPVKFELWDYDDFDSDDYMGEIIAPIYDNKNGFPKTVSIGCGLCTVGFTFYDISYL